MKLSVVVPVYNGQKTISFVCKGIEDSLSKAGVSDFEIILVDDGCPKGSWSEIQKLAHNSPQILGLRLSRNFGQHIALSAGIAESSGSFVALMDCDGQDDPGYLPLFMDKLENSEPRIVYGVRVARKDSIHKKWSSIILNWILSMLSGVKHDFRIGTYRMFDRVVADSILNFNERRRYLGGMFQWIGFEHTMMEVVHQNRFSGRSSYRLIDLFNLARLAILSGSTTLLSVAIRLSVTCVVIAVVFAVYRIYLKWYCDVPVGYTSVVVTILFSTSAILFCQGLIAEYLKELFWEVKRRPLWVCAERTKEPEQPVEL